MRAVLFWAAIIALVAFVAGFWGFAQNVRQEAEEPPQAQAIVALTGGSLERLTTGVRLLEERKGERLLISGVNRIVTDGELYHALNVDPAVGECCIDVGRSAEDTLGNASETAAWAREHRYTDIILVTDDITCRAAKLNSRSRCRRPPFIPTQCARAGPTPRCGAAISAQPRVWALST